MSELSQSSGSLLEASARWFNSLVRRARPCPGAGQPLSRLAGQALAICAFAAAPAMASTAGNGNSESRAGQLRWGTIEALPATELARRCLAVLDEPPADEQEARQLVGMKSQRTPEKIAQINAEAFAPERLFWLEAGLQKHDHQDLERFTRELLQESANAILMIKALYGRKRPHVVNAQVSPVIEVPWHSAYPSGHAAQAALLANIFSLANPDARSRLQALGLRVGRNREIAGVHYPSDTTAGRRLASCFWEAIQGH
jgi:hypothetical protein